MELLEALEFRPGWVCELFYDTPEGWISRRRCRRACLPVRRFHRRQGVLVMGKDVPGYASLMTAVLFFGEVQLLSLGVIGEYRGRLFNELHILI